jgi:hypothetical protein
MSAKATGQRVYIELINRSSDHCDQLSSIQVRQYSDDSLALALNGLTGWYWQDIDPLIFFLPEIDRDTGPEAAHHAVILLATRFVNSFKPEN